MKSKVHVWFHKYCSPFLSIFLILAMIIGMIQVPVIEAKAASPTVGQLTWSSTYNCYTVIAPAGGFSKLQVKADITYLDGHVETGVDVPVTLKNGASINDTNYWTGQPIDAVASFGSYHDTAKLSGPKQVDLKIIIFGDFNIKTVTADSVMGSVTSSIPDGKYRVGTSITVTATANNGYKFKEWQKNGVKVSTANPYTFGMPGEDATIKAVFEPRTYTVTFDKNTGNTPSQANKTVTFAAKYGTLASVTKEGHTFRNWHHTTVDGEVITANSIVRTWSNHTLVAEWERNYYTLTRATEAARRGTASGTVGSILFEGDCSVTTTITDGYSFIGWYEGATKVSSDVTYNFKMPSRHYNLVAKFTPNTYKVTFNPNNGVVGTTSKNVVFDSAYGTLPTPTRAGYKFTGWRLETANGVAISDTSVCITPRNHTLVASWQALPQTVTIWNHNGTEKFTTTFLTDSVATVDAGLWNAHWFKKWINCSYTNGIPENDTTSVHNFVMPPHAVEFTATWTTIVGIEANFNDLLYNTYSQAYDPIRDAFDLDKIPNNTMTITYDMLDIYLVQADGTKFKVTDTSEYILTGTVVTGIGGSDVKITFINARYPDGTNMVQLVPVEIFSSSLEAILESEGIDITDVKDRIDMLNKIISDSDDAATRIKLLIAELNEGVLIGSFSDLGLVDKLDNIEKELGDNLDLVREANSELSSITFLLDYIMNGTTNGTEYPEAPNMLAELANMKDYLSEINSELISTLDILLDIQNVLGLEPDATLVDVYTKVVEWRDKIAELKGDLSTVETILGNINLTIDEDTDLDLEVLEKLAQTSDYVDDIKSKLDRTNVGYNDLLGRVVGVVSGAAYSPTISYAPDIYGEIENLNIQLGMYNEKVTAIEGTLSDIKEELELEDSASLIDVLNKIKDLNAELDDKKGTIADIDSYLDELRAELRTNPDVTLDTVDKVIAAVDDATLIKGDLNTYNDSINALLNIVKGWNDSPTSENKVSKTVEEGLALLSNYIYSLEHELSGVELTISDLRTLLELDSSATLSEIYLTVEKLKDDMLAYKEDLDEIDKVITDVNNTLATDANSGKTLVDRVYNTESEVVDIKQRLEDYNSQIEDVRKLLDGISNGFVTGESLTEAKTIEQELDLLSKMLVSIIRDAENSSNYVEATKYALELAETATIKEMYEGVVDLNNKLKEKEELLLKYEDMLVEIHSKLGYYDMSDPDNYTRIYTEIMSGLNSVVMDVNYVDTTIITITNILATWCGDGSLSPYEAGTIYDAITEVKDTLGDVRTYVNNVSSFADAIISLFNITTESGEKPTFQEIIEFLVQYKSDSEGDLVEDLREQIKEKDEEIKRLEDEIEELKKQNCGCGDDCGCVDCGCCGDSEDSTSSSNGGNKNPTINKDTTGDGIPDINIDTNGDRYPDVNIDWDGDDKPDTNIDTNGDRLPDVNIDTDGDGIPDINIDSDGDGIPDTNIDTDGDGVPDKNVINNGKWEVNIDTNGDGKPDLNIDINGDGIPDVNIDINGDGIPDYNIDTDGDGIPDTNIRNELPSGGSSTTTNNTISGIVSTGTIPSGGIVGNTGANVNDIIRMQETINNQTATISKLTGDLQDKDAQIQDLTSKLDTVTTNDSNEDTIGTKGDVSYELFKSLQDELKDAEDKIADLEDELDKSNETIDTLRKTISDDSDTKDKDSKDYDKLLAEITKLKNDGSTSTVGDDSETRVGMSTDYDGMQLTNGDDLFYGITDTVVDGTRAIHIDSWRTSDGILLSKEGYLLADLDDTAWLSSVDLLYDYRRNRDEEITVHNVMLYQICVETGEFTMIMIDEVTYTPSVNR